MEIIFFMSDILQHEFFSKKQILSIIKERILCGVGKKKLIKLNPFITENQINETENFILSKIQDFRILSIKDQNGSVVGAYTPWICVFHLCIQWRNILKGEKHSSKPITIKCFIDNRKILGRKNEIFGVSLLEPNLMENFHSHSWMIPVVVFNSSENRNMMESVLNYTQFCNDWEHFQNIFSGSRIFMVNDWIASVCLHEDISYPNSVSMNDKLCFNCDYSVVDKILPFTDNIFKFWKSENPKTLLFGNIRNIFYKYDPMHCIARLSSNNILSTFNFISDNFPTLKTKYGEIVESFSFSTISGINCKDVKIFFRENLDLKFLQCVMKETDIAFINIKVGESNTDFQFFYSILKTILGSTKIFYEKIYNIRNFSGDSKKQDLKELMQARNSIIDVLQILNAEIPPASHYALNHFIENFGNDEFPQYYFLNEKDEAINLISKKLSNITQKNRVYEKDKFHTMEQLLRSHFILVSLKMNFSI